MLKYDNLKRLLLVLFFIVYVSCIQLSNLMLEIGNFRQLVYFDANVIPIYLSMFWLTPGRRIS